MKPAVLLVHGIGAQLPGWSDTLAARLRQKVREETVALLQLRSAKEDLQDMLAIAEVYWADVLQDRQQLLRTLLLGRQPPVEVHPAWWFPLLHPVINLQFKWRHLQARFISEFLGDIIGYLHPATKAAVQLHVGAALERLAGQAEPIGAKIPLTIVAHSLGTVVSSEYVWDQTKARAAKGQRGFHPQFALENFFTIGSPMALFSLQYGGPQAFQSPIALESPQGRWINIFDRDDPIGMPLKPLNEAYARVVWRDAEVNAGAYLLAHGGYFTEPRTTAIISHKLALDWLALNGRVGHAQVQRLYANYDETLGVPILRDRALA